MWFVFPLYRQLRVGNGRGCEIYNAKIRVMYSRVAFDEFGQPYIAEEELKLVENVRSCIKYVQQRSRYTAASRRSCCCRYIHYLAPTRSISVPCLHSELRPRCSLHLHLSSLFNTLRLWTADVAGVVTAWLRWR